MTDHDVDNIAPVEAQLVPDQSRPRPKPSESRRTVFLLLFVVLGPLAIGVLWKSSRFSRSWKIVLTVLTLIQFVVVVWLLWYVVNMFIEAF